MSTSILPVPSLDSVELSLIALAPFCGKRLVDFVSERGPLETIIQNVAKAMRNGTDLVDALACLNESYFGASFCSIRRRLPIGRKVEEIVGVIATEIRGILFDRSRAEFFLRARTATVGEAGEWSDLISEMLPEGWTINMFCSRRAAFFLTIRDQRGAEIPIYCAESVVAQVADSIILHLATTHDANAYAIAA